MIPPTRVRRVLDAPLRPGGAYVLYWMTAARRLEWNHALARAVRLARRFGKPLLILEALRVDHPWASRRLHRFCVDGMREHARRLEGSRVGYFPYLERSAGAGRGLLETLASDSVAVVADDSPAYFLPRVLAAAAKRLHVRIEAVDSNGLVPLADVDRDFATAHSFRVWLQRRLPGLLEEDSSSHPLRGAPLPPFPGISRAVAERWPSARVALLDVRSDPLAGLPVAAEPAEVPVSGGRSAAARRLSLFLDRSLSRYAADRAHPDRGATSGLSPFLHWGHLSAAEVVHAVLEREGWTPDRVPERASGARAGWWALSEGAEAFLDQVVTWRELGFAAAARDPESESWEALPGWARESLEAHAADPRPHVYDEAAFETARTHDPVWNAAQRELLRTGTIHNSLRMLWGKKILEWSESPREAFRIMVRLNHRWAVDGRDPNSTSGIGWVLGRYDRGWPRRPVFGKVRAMSSPRARAKLELEGYLAEFGDGGAAGGTASSGSDRPGTTRPGTSTTRARGT